MKIFLLAWRTKLPLKHPIWAALFNNVVASLIVHLHGVMLHFLKRKITYKYFQYFSLGTQTLDDIEYLWAKMEKLLELYAAFSAGGENIGEVLQEIEVMHSNIDNFGPIIELIGQNFNIHNQKMATLAIPLMIKRNKDIFMHEPGFISQLLTLLNGDYSDFVRSSILFYIENNGLAEVYSDLIFEYAQSIEQNTSANIITVTKLLTMISDSIDDPLRDAYNEIAIPIIQNEGFDNTIRISILELKRKISLSETTADVKQQFNPLNDAIQLLLFFAPQNNYTNCHIISDVISNVIENDLMNEFTTSSFSLELIVNLFTTVAPLLAKSDINIEVRDVISFALDSAAYFLSNAMENQIGFSMPTDSEWPEPVGDTESASHDEISSAIESIIPIALESYFKYASDSFENTSDFAASPFARIGPMMASVPAGLSAVTEALEIQCETAGNVYALASLVVSVFTQNSGDPTIAVNVLNSAIDEAFQRGSDELLTFAATSIGDFASRLPEEAALEACQKLICAAQQEPSLEVITSLGRVLAEISNTDEIFDEAYEALAAAAEGPTAVRALEGIATLARNAFGKGEEHFEVLLQQMVEHAQNEEVCAGAIYCISRLATKCPTLMKGFIGDVAPIAVELVTENSPALAEAFDLLVALIDVDKETLREVAPDVIAAAISFAEAVPADFNDNPDFEFLPYEEEEFVEATSEFSVVASALKAIGAFEKAFPEGIAESLNKVMEILQSQRNAPSPYIQFARIECISALASIAPNAVVAAKLFNMAASTIQELGDGSEVPAALEAMMTCINTIKQFESSADTQYRSSAEAKRIDAGSAIEQIQSETPIIGAHEALVPLMNEYSTKVVEAVIINQFLSLGLPQEPDADAIKEIGAEAAIKQFEIDTKLGMFISETTQDLGAVEMVYRTIRMIEAAVLDRAHSVLDTIVGGALLVREGLTKMYEGAATFAHAIIDESVLEIMISPIRNFNNEALVATFAFFALAVTSDFPGEIIQDIYNSATQNMNTPHARECAIAILKALGHNEEAAQLEASE